MPRNSTMMEERAYATLLKHGPLNTREILDKINNWTCYNGTLSQKGYSMHQLAQKLRVSPFFLSMGYEKMPTLDIGSSSTTDVLKYDLYPVELVVQEKLAIIEGGGTLSTPVSKMPRFFKKEWVKQGGKL